MMKRLMIVTASALAAIAVSASTASAQDAAAGQRQFNKCLPCHAVGPDAENKIGPELNGLDGRHSGTAPNYSYSDANKNSGIVWNEESFKEYIKNPAAKVPGTKMTFAGIKNDQDVNDLWAYLKQYDADGNTKN
jgi:cytochrome c